MFSSRFKKHPRQLFHLPCQVLWFELSCQWTCYAEEDTGLGTQHWASLCTRWNADRKQLYGSEVGRRWSLFVWLQIYLQVRYRFRAPNDPTNLKGTIWSLINKRDKFSSGFKIIMNRKRAEISQCFIRREELVQMKIEFRLLFCPNFWFTYICKPHVIKLCVIQLLQFVFQELVNISDLTSVLICFTVPLRALFVLSIVYRF